MNKIFIISLILFLILFTTIIKNSTKKIEEGIFSLEENIRVLKNEFNNVQLDIATLKEGAYLIKINSNDGVIAKKFNVIK